MANNYLQFSEVIPDITPEEQSWIEQQLDPGLGKQDDDLSDRLMDSADIGAAEADEIRRKLGYEWPMPLESIQEECDPDFQADVDSDRDLWIRAEEFGGPYRVGEFVQAFIRKFRPDFIFSLTWAAYCDKLRIGEFYGGGMVVTRDAIEFSNAYDWVSTKVAEIEDRRKYGPTPEV